MPDAICHSIQCMSAADWAAWVQAVGAISAIGASIFIARGDVRRRHEEKRMAVRDAIGTAIKIGGLASAEIAGVLSGKAETVHVGNNFTFSVKPRFRHMAETLGRIDTTSMSGDVVIQVMNMQIALNDCVVGLDHHLIHEKDAPAWKHAFNNAENILREAKVALRQSLNDDTGFAPTPSYMSPMSKLVAWPKLVMARLRGRI